MNSVLGNNFNVFSVLSRKVSHGGPSEFRSTNAFTFSDIDLLESGTAKETMSDYQLTPLSEKLKKLQKCYVLREDRTKFWLYCENTRSCLLSAKLVGSDFYISMYEEFPSQFKSEDQLLSSRKVGAGNTFCSVVRLNESTKSYTLYNRTCEGCDNLLGIHSCGGSGSLDRQVLAQIKHRAGRVNAGGEWVDCNTVAVDLPTVYDDLSRDIWCPRFTKAKLPETVKRSHSFRSKLKQFDSERIEYEEKEEDLDENRSAPEIKIERSPIAGAPNKGFTLNTRKPRFDRNSGSLRMKFLNNRVRMASSKNLIFCMNTEEPSNNSEDDDLNQVPVLQFGRFSDERFNLDYGFPLSPLQAFAITLSLFQWQGPNAK